MSTVPQGVSCQNSWQDFDLYHENDLVVEKATENIHIYKRKREKRKVKWHRAKECRVCSRGRCAYVLVMSVRNCKITLQSTNSYVCRSWKVSFIQFILSYSCVRVILMICWFVLMTIFVGGCQQNKTVASNTKTNLLVVKISGIYNLMLVSTKTICFNYKVSSYKLSIFCGKGRNLKCT